MSETRLVRHRAPATGALSAIALAAFGTLSDTSEHGTTTTGRVIVAQNNTGDKSGTAAEKKEKFEAAKKAKLEAAKKEKLEAAKKEKAAAKLDEEALAAKKAAAKAAKARAAKSDDDDDDAKGKGKKQCPPGQRPAPSRGRGGDAGGCI